MTLNPAARDRVLMTLNERLDRLEEKANHIRVPEFYANLLYTLRMHIALVRERMTRLEKAHGDGRG